MDNNKDNNNIEQNGTVRQFWVTLGQKKHYTHAATNIGVRKKKVVNIR